MKLLKKFYERKTGTEAPYYYNYSLLTIVFKPIRKLVSQVLAPNCPFNNLRILLYRMCGFKIGKGVFIGMKCYLDDMCFDLIEIKNNVTISYGVYFSCHGKGQGHNKIIIENKAYLGMRCNVITSSGDVIIGAKSIIGAGSLVNKSVPDSRTAVGVPIRILTEEVNSNE